VARFPFANSRHPGFFRNRWLAMPAGYELLIRRAQAPLGRWGPRAAERLDWRGAKSLRIAMRTQTRGGNE